jgi:hypothetical protein
VDFEGVEDFEDRLFLIGEVLGEVFDEVFDEVFGKGDFRTEEGVVVDWVGVGRFHVLFLTILEDALLFHILSP